MTVRTSRSLSPGLSWPSSTAAPLGSMFLMYIGQWPPVRLSLVVILKPRPALPLVSCILIFFPILRVLVGATIFDLVWAERAVLGLRTGTAGGTFLEGEEGSLPSLLLLSLTVVVMFISLGSSMLLSFILGGVGCLSSLHGVEVLGDSATDGFDCVL